MGVSSDSSNVNCLTKSALGSALNKLAKKEYISALSCSSSLINDSFVTLIEFK